MSVIYINEPKQDGCKIKDRLKSFVPHRTSDFVLRAPEEVSEGGGEEVDDFRTETEWRSSVYLLLSKRRCGLLSIIGPPLKLRHLHKKDSPGPRLGCGANLFSQLATQPFT